MGVLRFILIVLGGGVLMSAQGSDFKKPSQSELKKLLTPEQYSCTQEEGTEAPFKNRYWNHHEDGIYVDIVSGEALFSSLDKYDSGSGWPSFTRPIDEGSLTTKIDMKIGVRRTEVRSKGADSHLGHVFDDGPGPTKKRFCINSASLQFVSVKEMKDKGYGKYLYLFAEKMKWQTALLAGGCFWGVQELFRKQKGVIYSEVGYTGGEVANAEYESVKKGTSGHAEAVRVIFDPQQTSYENLLLYFFKIHDPTTRDQQGNDKGTQYRSEIFFVANDQKQIAEKVKDRVDRSKKWGGPVVTKISKAQPFWRGEEYHQDYLQKHPGGYTCHFPRDFDF